MERVFERDDFCADGFAFRTKQASVRAGEFERSFPGFGAGVGEEDAVEASDFGEAERELYGVLGVEEVRGVDELGGLRGDGARDRGVVVAERADTDAGEQMYRAVSAALRTLTDTMERIVPGAAQHMVTVTSSIAFCSLWLIPRLAAFRKRHPALDVRVSANNDILDLDRERIDVAIRYCPVEKAPAGAIRMFGEEIVPVCSPALLRDRTRQLKTPADLANHVLLHFDDIDRAIPSLSWSVWLEAEGLADLKPAASLRFSHYDQVVNAALGGQGVALGRRARVRNFIAEGALVTPLARTSAVDRAYYLVRTPATRARGEVDDFVQWLISESAELTPESTAKMREETTTPHAPRKARKVGMPTKGK